MKFSMTCSCGDIMDVEAENLHDAKTKMKDMMTQETIDAHCAEKHPDMKMSKTDVDMQIDEKLMAAM